MARMRHQGGVDERDLIEALERRQLLSADLYPKLGAELSTLYANYATADAAARGQAAGYTVAASQPNAGLLPVSGGLVDVKAVAKGKAAATLAGQIRAAGGTITGLFGRIVTATVPIGSLAALSGSSALNFATPAYRPQFSAGKIDDQGVPALRADVAGKQYSVNGAGVTVGILSDSYNKLGGAAADVTSGDLPAGVNVLKEGPVGQTDEGRAMAQAVYDAAPGVGLAFHTAAVSQADFAAGILNLAKPVAQGGAGAKVLVDDVTYPDEPIFQDGIVAQAVNTAVTTYGASYFSAAGNDGRNAYQAAFRPLAATVPGVGPGTFHNFDPGGTNDIYQRVAIAAGDTLTLTWQWDQPYASAGGPGARSDLDVYLVNPGKTSIVASAASDNLGKDPIEVLSYTNNTGATAAFYLVARLFDGPAPALMKYVMLGAGTIQAFKTNSPSLYGHAQATNAAAVGAADYHDTPAYGRTPPVAEPFSSAGGSPILFDAAGNRLATPEVRQQPRFVAVDGADNTFFGGDLDGNGARNFVGTSAAAAHAAGIGALLKQAIPSLTASQIYSAMQSSTVDMAAAGYDFDTGFGLVQADKALAAAAGSTISGTVFRDYDNDGTRDAGEPGLPNATVFLDANNNGVVDSATSGTLASTNVPKAIPDAGSAVGGSPSRVTSNLTVSGLTGRVTKVTVSLNVTHTFASDLGLTLVSPKGIRVPLLSTLGGAEGKGKGYNLTLDDAAAAAVQSAAINPTGTLAGTYRPQVRLAAVAGENPNGTWQLEARDYDTPDTGTIVSWSMRISYADPTATTNAAGGYAFAGLPPSAYYGAYTVRQLPVAGLTRTSPASPYNLTLTPATGASGRDFGNFAPLGTVASTVVDDAASGQRSMVRKLVVRFNGSIAAGGIAAGAFVVTKTSGAPSDFATSVFAVTPVNGGSQTDVELRFSGPGVAGGSLADGNYTLTVDGSKLADSSGAPVDAAGAGAGASAKVVAFHRLFGDQDGNKTVNNGDYVRFRNAFGSATGAAAYNSIFDYDSNGSINNGDYLQLRTRFGVTLA